jgi:hypothetical protein
VELSSKKSIFISFQAKNCMRGYYFSGLITFISVTFQQDRTTMAISSRTIIDNNFLQAVSEATSGLTGHDLLLEIAKRITTSLGMQYCFIAECANETKTRLRTVIYVEGKKVLDNFEYNTHESGCQMMMKGDTFFMPAGAQKLFPAAKGIEAYVGAPIISPATGEILGHIAATDPGPVSD